jgi:LysR family transcriptional regulator, low CO2-responsive transcriptional regulator
MHPLKNATFRQLAAFHAVARLGSVSRAAEEVHLTQPAVSIQLRILEESAGTPLLQRTGRGIRLTEAGELLADHAERILQLWREAGEDMAAHCGDLSGTLRVGAVTTAEYLLPPLLLAFVREHPKVKVKLQVGNRNDTLRLLASQEVDLAIMGRPPAELKTAAAPFATHPMAFVASPTHALMHMPHHALTLQAINDANLLVRERGSGTRHTLEQLYKAAGLTLRIGSEMSSNEAIKQMCIAGFSPAFLSLHACLLELETGRLAVLPMTNNPIEREWYVMHLAAKKPPAAAAAFELYLRQEGQEEIDKQLNALRDKFQPTKLTLTKIKKVLKKSAATSAASAVQRAAPAKLRAVK